MAKPTPGKEYTVQDENSLSQVSLRAYGDATLWPRIWNANQTVLRSGDPDIIFPGEVLVIPRLPERAAQKSPLANKSPDEITLTIDGLEIPTESFRLLRTMDTAADQYTAVIAWEPGLLPELDKRVLPFTYPSSTVHIGKELMLTGALYTPNPKLSSRGTTIDLLGYSATIDIVDSTLRPPYEENNVDLKQRAHTLIKPLGLDIVFDVDPGGQFSRVTATETDKIFTHLNKLAGQRALLISSTPEGAVLFTKARPGRSVGTIEEGQLPVQELSGVFNGRQRFNIIRLIGQSPAGNKVGQAQDKRVPKSRFLTFRADEVISGEIDEAARWRRSKQLVDALTMPFPVNGWFDPRGRLWRENTLVTLVSRTLHVPQGFDFLIRSVEYTQDGSGQRAILNLIPPQAYTGEELVDPWQ